MLQELRDRQASDPLHTYTLHRKQAPFARAVLNGPTLENWMFAANRSGKTDIGTYCDAHLARFGLTPLHSAWSLGGRLEIRDRATSGWVVGLDYPSLRDIVQPKLFDNGFVGGGSAHAPFIPAREIADWRAGDQVLKLKNGSIIGFKSCESGRLKFQGSGKDWIHFDEEPPQSIYQECTIRVEGGRRLRIFGTCTLLPPEGQVGGVTWAFSDIVQPWQRGEAPDVAVFNASIYDNPYIDRAEIARLEAKYPEGSIERRIRLNGELLPGLSGSRAYTSFNRQLHVHTQPPPIYRLPLAWTWDFNVEPMVSYVGQYLQGTFHIYKELVMNEGNIPAMCDWFRQAYPAHGAEIWIYGDGTGGRRSNQSGVSNYTVMLNNMLTYPTPVRLKVPELNPPVPDRINAFNTALVDEHGAVGWECDPTCVELIADLEQVLRDERAGIKKTSKPTDPYSRRTHMSDAVGYWVYAVKPVVSTQPRRFGSAAHKPIKRPSYGFSRR